MTTNGFDIPAQPLVSRAGLILGVNRGVRSDAPAWEFRTGVAFTIDSPFSKR